LILAQNGFEALHTSVAIAAQVVHLRERHYATVVYGGGAYPMSFYTNDTERMRITANGLTFNGDTAAANALDDYEEGEWTMGVAFGGASVGVTYTLNGRNYTLKLEGK
jgi:hypothetical protein